MECRNIDYSEQETVKVRVFARNDQFIEDTVISVMMVNAAYGSENSWTIADSNGNQICAGDGYASRTNVTVDSCDLSEGEEYTVTCMDRYGNGWHGGYLQIGD
jgi:hypothetical protein